MESGRIIHFWLDDTRPPINTKYFWIKTYKEAIKIFTKLDKNVQIVLSTDHDLGPKKTGYDFCKWLVEEGWTGKFHCHTANPVGAANMRQLLTHYGWEEF